MAEAEPEGEMTFTSDKSKKVARVRTAVEQRWDNVVKCRRLITGDASGEPEPEDTERVTEYDAGLVNYVDFDERKDLLETMLEPFVDAVTNSCEELEARFGFQHDSVRNQHENVVLLLSNVYSHRPDEIKSTRSAIVELHNRTFGDDDKEEKGGSYRGWCRMMRIKEDLFLPDTEDGAAYESTKIKEIVLWWCIWGEAANLRFMPECLSYIFYLAKTDFSDHRTPPARDEDTFLEKIVKPIYQVVSTEMKRANQFGDLYDHPQKKNYDDLNECFWDKKLVFDDQGAPRLKWSDGTASLRPKLSHLFMAEGETDVPTTKTFVERRGIFHSFQANLRVFSFYFIFYQLMLSVSFDVPFPQDWLPLCPLPDQTVKSDGTILASTWDEYSPVICDQDIVGTMCSYTNIDQQLYQYDCLEIGGKKVAAAAAKKAYDPTDNNTAAAAAAGAAAEKAYHTNYTKNVDTVFKKYSFFDDEWRGDDQNYKKKRDFLTSQTSFFTCGFNRTDDAIMMAGNVNEKAKAKNAIMMVGNHSTDKYCCRVMFQGNSDVWAYSTCRDIHQVLWDALPDGFSFKHGFELAPDGHRLRMSLCSTVLTVSAFRLLEEVLGTWVSLGIIRAQGMLCGCLFRLGVRFISCGALLIFYVLWTIELSSTSGGERRGESELSHYEKVYLAVATLIMIPEFIAAICQMAPSFHVKCNAVRGCICCKNRKYKDVMGQMHTNFQTHIWYSLTWIVLLSAKCWFSYNYEIRLALKDSATIWEAMSNVQHDVSSEEFAVTAKIADVTDDIEVSHVLRLFMLFIFWIPTTIIFLIDAQVIFALVQMVAGLAVGWRQQVGSIHDWQSFLLRFHRIWQFIGLRLSVEGTPEWQKVHLHRRKMRRESNMRGSFITQQDSLQAPLMHSSGGVQSPFAPAQSAGGRCRRCRSCWPCGRKSSAGNDHEVDGSSESYELKDRHVRQIWNQFIENLRADDYISDSEMSLYMHLDSLGGWKMGASSNISFLPPPVLTLRGISRILEYIKNERQLFQHEHRTSPARVNRNLVVDAEQEVRHCISMNEEQRKRINVVAKQLFDRISHNSLCVVALEQVRDLSLSLLRQIVGQSLSDLIHQKLDEKFSSWAIHESLSGRSSTDPDPMYAPFCEMTQIEKKATDSFGIVAKNHLIKLAREIVKICRAPPGISKQTGVKFQRPTGKVGKDSVETVRSSLRGILKLLVEALHDPDLAAVQNAQLTGHSGTDWKRFLEDDSFASSQLKKLDGTDDDAAYRVATYLLHLLETEDFEAQPKCEEAKRRLFTFASSVRMNMPKPPAVAKSKSLTTLTPFYDEFVMFSKEEMMQVCPSTGNQSIFKIVNNQMTIDRDAGIG
jgi:hypothetical protein